MSVHLNHLIIRSNLVLMDNMLLISVGEISLIQLLPNLGKIRRIGIIPRWVVHNVYPTKCAFAEEAWA